MKNVPMRVAQMPMRLNTMQPGSWRPSNAGANERGYTYAWQQARLRFLRENPICEICDEAGDVTPATVVDHRIPHRGDQELFWRQSNWRPLCKPHHDSDAQKKDNEIAAI